MTGKGTVTETKAALACRHGCWSMVAVLSLCSLFQAALSFLASDQREAHAADGEAAGDDAQVGRPMGLAQIM